jgi:hypothetical protein
MFASLENFFPTRLKNVEKESALPFPFIAGCGLFTERKKKQRIREKF